jgi:hypothetical protein
MEKRQPDPQAFAPSAADKDAAIRKARKTRKEKMRRNM